MKDVEFIRLSKENINIISNVVRIDNEELSKQDIEKFIIDDDNYCFVGILEDKIVAFLYSYGMLRPDGKSMFYIHSIDVLQDYQNNGIGTKLMEYVLNYVKNENKYYKFFVLAENDNIRACKVYQKFANKEEQVIFSRYLKGV
ncbi:MAG: GNAT family N-acetyltransferase [Clostridia bacterium]|nr:GNAT family N-acetyltransferase [Clostridia bacterium]